jgi:hypothetical protein
MNSVVDHVKSALPPIGAGLAGLPWWAVTAIIIVFYGPVPARAWIDVWRYARDPAGGKSNTTD